MIDVAHHDHDRVTGPEISSTSSLSSMIRSSDGDDHLPLDLGVEFTRHQVCGIEIDFLVGRRHNPEPHQFFDDFGDGGLEPGRQLGHGDGLAHRDGDRLHLPLHLDAAQPFGLGFPAGMRPTVLLGFLIDFLLLDPAAVAAYLLGGLGEHVELFRHTGPH